VPIPRIAITGNGNDATARATVRPVGMGRGSRTRSGRVIAAASVDNVAAAISRTPMVNRARSPPVMSATVPAVTRPV
jgi:hypothetical protein